MPQVRVLSPRFLETGNSRPQFIAAGFFMLAWQNSGEREKRMYRLPAGGCKMGQAKRTGMDHAQLQRQSRGGNER